MKKIFVTTGSSIGYEELFNYIYEFNDQFEITIQLGNSKFNKPKCKFFSFTPEIKRYYEWADIIIFTGGAATIFEVLQYEKKLLIGVANPVVLDNHQQELLQELNQNQYLFFAQKLTDIEDIISHYDENLKQTKEYTYNNSNLLEYVYSYIHDIDKKEI